MVHLFENNGYYIALDSASGSVHDLDEVAYAILERYENTPREELKEIILARFGHRDDVNEAEIEEVFADIETLKAAGQLFSEDRYEGVAKSFAAQPQVIKALCLHVAHDCNLSCGYCFAGKGEYCGERSLMSFETGKRALDFLIAHSGSRRNLEVDFFGGEPLLNFEVVKELTAYARKVEKAAGKNFRFTLTTNGVLLDGEVIDFCNREMSNVVLSLDGRREVNDRFRRTKNNKGSYDLILPKFQRLVAARGGKDYYIRGTYTHFNPDFAADVLHMADLGFKELSMEPVVSSPTEPYALNDADLPILLEQYDLLGRELARRARAGKPITFYHYMIDLAHGPCIVKRVKGCGVGNEYMAVTPDGDLYPCHQFVGDGRFRLGNVFTGIDNEALREQFKNCNVYAHRECDRCFARFFCSGGCAANAYHATGNIDGVYAFGCELHKKRIENAIMLKVAEARAAQPEAAGEGR